MCTVINTASLLKKPSVNVLTLRDNLHNFVNHVDGLTYLALEPDDEPFNILEKEECLMDASLAGITFVYACTDGLPYDSNATDNIIGNLVSKKSVVNLGNFGYCTLYEAEILSTPKRAVSVLFYGETALKLNGVQSVLGFCIQRGILYLLGSKF